MGIAKKGLSVLLLIATLFSLSGCSDDEVADSPSPSPRPSHTPIRIQASNTSDLFGQWEQFDSEVPGLHQVAIISGDVIEIYWVNEETDAQYLYWSGSFPEEESIESSYSWTSKNNIEKAEVSPLASWDETKDFTFEDGRIKYATTTLNTPYTMYLEKNTWNSSLSADDFFENGTFPISSTGLEFLIPDYFTETQTEKGRSSVTLNHGSSSCRIVFWEYNINPQEFDKEKWAIIENSMSEGAERISGQDITLAGFDGVSFLYHMVSQNNVVTNVYGVLLCNPQEEKALLVAFPLAREENYQNFFNKIIESAIAVKSDTDDKTMGYDIAIVYGAGPTLRVAYFFDFDKGIMTQMYIHNKYHSSEYTGTDHIYTVEIGGDLESGWYTYPNGDAHNYYELVVEEDGTERIYYYNSRHDLLDTYRVSSVEDWIFYLRDGLSGKSEKTQEGLLTPDKK